MTRHSTLFGYPKAGLIFGGVSTIFLINGVLGVVGPALANMGAAYPDVPFNLIMWVSTLPSITALIANAFLPLLIKGMKYKGALLFGLIAFVITGIAPYFCASSFTAILVFRAVNGVARGIISPLAFIMAAMFYEGRAGANIQGLGNTFANIMGLICSLGGGVLAAMYVHNVWWLNLVMLVPAFFWLFIKEPSAVMQPESGTTEANEKSVPQVKEPMPKVIVFLLVIMALMVLFMYPYQLYVSSFVAQLGEINAMVSGVVLSGWSIGGIISGFLIAQFNKIFKGRAAGVFCLGMVGLCLIYAFGKSAAILMMGSLLGGFSYAVITSTVYAALGNWCPASRRDLAMTISQVVSAIVIFVCTYVMQFLAGIFGQPENINLRRHFCGA